MGNIVIRLSRVQRESYTPNQRTGTQIVLHINLHAVVLTVRQNDDDDLVFFRSFSWERAIFR